MNVTELINRLRIRVHDAEAAGKHNLAADLEAAIDQLEICEREHSFAMAGPIAKRDRTARGRGRTNRE
jgi:hypothetical protein